MHPRDSINVLPFSVTLLLLLVGAIAWAIPLRPSEVGMMTPLHRSLAGVYGQ